MGLFGKKKETAPAVPSPKTAQAATVVIHDPASVILKPRITEKAALLSERNVYTSEVLNGATK